MKKIFDIIIFVLTGGGDIARRAVCESICDFSGQGRDCYGK